MKRWLSIVASDAGSCPWRGRRILDLAFTRSIQGSVDPCLSNSKRQDKFQFWVRLPMRSQSPFAATLDETTKQSQSRARHVGRGGGFHDGRAAQLEA